jgi:hypothetical protein
MSKVRDMMVKHQIEMHELRQEPDPLGQHNQGLILSEQWMMAVCHIGAEYLGCASVFQVFTGSDQIGCKLYGRKSACETAMVMLGYWLGEVKRMSDIYLISTESIGNALALRFARLLDEQGPAPATNGTDLVPIDEAKAAASSGEPTEAKEVDIKTDIIATIVAENISLNMQTSGPQRHAAIAETGE